MSTELLTTAVDCFWLFFGGVLVFFMQTGFTMVEAGFTRSKNTGNIIMKNIVDFMFGQLFIGLSVTDLCTAKVTDLSVFRSEICL